MRARVIRFIYPAHVINHLVKRANSYVKTDAEPKAQNKTCISNILSE